MTCEPNTTAKETPNETPAGRASNGRFARGNRGGPGNPFARQTARLRQAALDAVSPEDIKATFDALKKKSAEGDVPAAKLLLSYCVGKPVEPADPDTLDQHELKTIVGNHLDSSAGPVNIVKGMPLDILVEMFELILPVLRSEKVKMAKKVLCAPLTEEEIEANQDDEDDDVSEDDAAAPAYDPFANIPEWMQDIGKESEQPPSNRRRGAGPQAQEGAPGEAGETAEAPRPKEAEVDAELLRVLLERASHLAGGQRASGQANIDCQPAAADRPLHQPEAQARDPEALPRTLGVPRPSANGTNGKRQPPSANGTNGKK